MSKDNILLLPNTIAEMELEIESLMQKKDFEKALNNLELLLKHNHCTYMVYRDTLTCLMKLHHTNEAVDLCEKLLMDKQSEFYYDYLEFYIILLYESEAYSTLIHVFETEKNNMPHEYADRTEKFKVLALQMRTWQQEEKLSKLLDAVQKKDALAQHRIILQWRRNQLPLPELFKEMLSEEDIHPVVKTELFIILQEADYQEEVIINKACKSLSFSPRFMLPLEKHPSYLKSMETIEEVEQQNPVLYILTKEIIDHYMFVLYPVLHDAKDAEVIARHALAIAKRNLGIDDSSTMENDKLIQNIMMNLERYQEIML